MIDVSLSAAHFFRKSCLGHAQAVPNSFYDADAANGDFRRSKLSSPLANILKIKALKPLAFVASGSAFSTVRDQSGFGCTAVANAFKEPMFNKLNADTCNAVSVRGNASGWIDAPSDLDMAVAEMADVEVFHLSRRAFLWAEVSEVGPDTVCVIWTQLLACDLSAGGFFNGQTVLSRDIPATEPVRYCGLDNTDLIGESFLASDDGNCFV
jgi:hypothetical protein